MVAALQPKVAWRDSNQPKLADQGTSAVAAVVVVVVAAPPPPSLPLV